MRARVTVRCRQALRFRRSLLIAAAALTLAAIAAGCGHSAPRHITPVRLSSLSPTDGVRVSTSTVTISGTVEPHHAAVMVLGRRVTPGSGGHFSTSVALTVGTNLIDVIASSREAQPAMTALRVVRYVLVTVPSVGGRSPKAAAAAIRAVGLVPKVEGASDPFSFLLFPLSSEVCSQSPKAGTRVNPRSTVTLSVGKVCF